MRTFRSVICTAFQTLCVPYCMPAMCMLYTAAEQLATNVAWVTDAEVLSKQACVRRCTTMVLTRIHQAPC